MGLEDFGNLMGLENIENLFPYLQEQDVEVLLEGPQAVEGSQTVVVVHNRWASVPGLC